MADERERAEKAADAFVSEVVEICAKAEGFDSYRDSDWSLTGITNVRARLAAALLREAPQSDAEVVRLFEKVGDLTEALRKCVAEGGRLIEENQRLRAGAVPERAPEPDAWHKDAIDAVENLAARMSYEAGLGASEWESFIDTAIKYVNNQWVRVRAGPEGEPNDG